MAKSAAKMKPAPKKPELPPIEKVFDEAKEMFAMTVDTQVKTAERVDNLLNIRDYLKAFFGEAPDILKCKKYQQVSIDTYRQVRKAVDEFTLEDFEKETIKDYFEDILVKVENIVDDEDLCRAGLVFMSVQPYGGKLIKMHQLIQEEIAKRKDK